MPEVDYRGQPAVAEYAISPSSGGAYYSDYDEEYITKESYVKIKVQQGALESKYDEMADLLEDEGAKLSNIQYNEYSDRKQYTVTAKVDPRKFDSINEKLQQIGEVKDLSVSLEDVSPPSTWSSTSG
jgi:hypothetical protein